MESRLLRRELLEAGDSTISHSEVLRERPDGLPSGGSSGESPFTSALNGVIEVSSTRSISCEARECTLSNEEVIELATLVVVLAERVLSVWPDFSFSEISLTLWS
jgi:hypothetical protein